MPDINFYYDVVVGEGLATEDEIGLVFNIIGVSRESINKIVFARTGYHSVEQWADCKGVDLSIYYE